MSGRVSKSMLGAANEPDARAAGDLTDRKKGFYENTHL